MPKLKSLVEDKRSWWITKVDIFRMYCFKQFSGFITSIIFFIRGIKKDTGCRFFGIPHFRRFQFSEISMGKNCTLRSDQTSNLIGVNRKCIFSTHSSEAKIIIGDNCGFSGVTIGAASEIRIGNNVLCGANVVITDFDWHNDISNTHPEPVIIHDNAWIGLNTVILKGVTIGENSIIGANSLVLKDVPENVVAGGNQCKVLKTKS